jgi:hypothetical protein
MNIHEKLKKIEALIERSSFEGEREAALLAKHRLQQKAEKKTIEYTVTNTTTWKKKLFVAICNKHGLKTYRYKRQKYSTSMVRVSQVYMDEILWPEFKKYADLFEDMVSEITSDLVQKIYHGDQQETVIAGAIS